MANQPFPAAPAAPGKTVSPQAMRRERVLALLPPSWAREEWPPPERAMAYFETAWLLASECNPVCVAFPDDTLLREAGRRAARSARQWILESGFGGSMLDEHAKGAGLASDAAMPAALSIEERIVEIARENHPDTMQGLAELLTASGALDWLASNHETAMRAESFALAALEGAYDSVKGRIEQDIAARAIGSSSNSGSSNRKATNRTKIARPAGQSDWSKHLESIQKDFSAIWHWRRALFHGTAARAAVLAEVRKHQREGATIREAAQRLGGKPHCDSGLDPMSPRQAFL